MKQGTKDLGFMALIAGAGAVGILATLFVLVATRGPAAAPEPPPAPVHVDVRHQAVQEPSERVAMIRIRGSASLGERTPPTIYIDGVRVEGDREEALQQLSPDQIDRIEVIRGDAAKERYGSEAANGVIEIVTKSGEGS